MSVADVSLIEALDDPELFAPLFQPASSWARWRSFLTALFGLPLSGEAFEHYKTHTGRDDVPSRPYREAALVCGRKGGKSRVLALVAVYLACFFDYSPYLAPGEVPTVAIIAADRRQGRIILRYVIGLLQSVKLLFPLIDGEPGQEHVTLVNGVRIEIHTNGIASPRGRTFVAIMADKIAFWRTTDSAANPDREVIAAVRPGLLTIPTSMLLLASSPYSKAGVLWEAYRRHWGKAGARVLVWQATTEEMHPTVDREFIAEELANDPASAEAEYFARFRTDVAAYIDKEVVEGLVMRGRRELPPVSTITYAGFVDSSGGSSDEMCVAVGHRGPRGEGILDCVRGRLPPFSPDSVVKEFADLLKSYRVLTVIGDKYAGEWPIERFQHHGITYEVAEKNKSQYYVEFLPLLMSGRVELLDNQRMVNQLASLERKTGRGTGRDVVDHPSGHAYHDDLANVCAGVLVEVAGALDGGEETRRYLSGMAGWVERLGVAA